MATITVTTNVDEDDQGINVNSPGGTGLSLREAISLANSSDTIVFDSSVFDGGTNSLIRLTLGELDITRSMTIDGSSATDIVITGDANDDDQTYAGTNITDISKSFNAVLNAADDFLNDNSRVFDISTFSDTTLIGLTVTGGRTTGFNSLFGTSTAGGGISSNSDLTLINTTVAGNSTFGGSADGGGVFVNGDIRLLNSSIFNNSTAGSGAEGGGVFSFENAVIVNSTIAGNSTAGLLAHGGGIRASEDILAIHSTISGNSVAGSSASGGGVYSLLGDVTITNSIVLGNVSNTTTEDEVVEVAASGSTVDGVITFNGSNIVGANNTVFDASISLNVVNALPENVFTFTQDTQIDSDEDGITDLVSGISGGLLADNGGAVSTIALSGNPLNPALDSTNSAFLSENVGGADFNGDGDTLDTFNTDARGLARSFDISLTGIDFSGLSDLGAFELTSTNSASADSEAIYGSSTGDLLSGLSGNDQLFGFDGDDLLTGGLDADFIDGGDGIFDTANYGQSLQGITITLDGGPGSGGEAEGDVVTNVEQVIGSIFSDVITGNNANNVFFGFGGDDQLFGGEGSDFLLGGAGADHLDGGNGILDTADYRASQAGVTVNLIAGTGLGGDAEGDTLVNIDQLLGSALGDSLTGNDENNILFGFSGDDTLSAGIGNDFLVSGLGADTLIGGLGSDTANYLSSTLGVAVDLANNVAIGGEADGDTLISIENIIGTNSSDTLLGNAENNLLFGFGGDDVFNFTAGVDTINGGTDTDRVIFNGNQADFNLVDRSDIGSGVVFADDGSGQNVAALFDIEFVTFNDTGTFDLSTLV